jgi:hypothetical protein
MLGSARMEPEENEMTVAQNADSLESPAERGRGNCLADLLVEVGWRAHEDALARSPLMRVELLASVAREWDGTAYISRWCNGKKGTYDGEALSMSWVDFGALLETYSHEIVGKGEGPWFTPGLTKNGRCRDEDISEITQLALDADNVGDWGPMQALLGETRIAHVMHRSSSHTPERPKWHLHIPLYLHWSGDKLEWRSIYRHCVAWFSAAAELSYNFNGRQSMYGFDKSTDRLGQPWFPPTRRNEDAVPAETICKQGLALDMEAFLHVTGFDLNFEPAPKDPRARKPKDATRHRRLASAMVKVTTGTMPDFLLGVAFDAAGMLGPKVGEDKWSVVCPWESEHTTGHALDSSTVIFSPTKKGRPGWFHCRHGHCEGRTVREVLMTLPAAALAAAIAAQRDAVIARAPLGGGER